MENTMNADTQIQEKVNLSGKLRKEVLSLRFLLLGAIILLAIAVSIIIVTFFTRNTSQIQSQTPLDNSENAITDTEAIGQNESTSSNDTSDTTSNVQQEADKQTYTANVPEDWSVFESCGVRVPVPPKKGLYYVQMKSEPTREEYNNDVNSGRYWSVTKREIASDIQRGDEISVNYDFDGRLGSGFVPSNVLTQCLENKDNLSLDSYFSQLQDSLINNEVGIRISKFEKLNKWGVEAYKVNFTGGFYVEGTDYYYVVSQKYIYTISSVNMLEKEFVKETNKQILDNISFLKD